MSDEEKFDASLDLLRRLDPRKISTNLNDICAVLQNESSANEELTLDLLSSVDTPLKTAKCEETGKFYLCCDYNRDEDSYRSPWSNKYYPASKDSTYLPPYPSNVLRELEIKANDAFDIYRDLYYEGAGISSTYMWETAEDESADPLQEGFAGIVLFKKEVENGSGKWDSIHVFEILPESSSSALYKLTTTVILDLSNKSSTSLSLSGNLTRQIESVQSLSTEGALNLETAHLINIGQVIEKAESNIRNLLQEVYFDKLKDIMLRDLISVGNNSAKKVEQDNQAEVIKNLQGL